MAVASFSMGDLQNVWEQGGRNAYFAAGAGAVGGGISMREANMNAIADNAKAKTQQMVKVTNAQGKTFFQRRMGNIKDAGKAIKAGASSAAVGTAGYASRGVQAVGSGGVLAGMQVRRLGSAIAANPRTAGAVILGGTALGVGGGAYALSQRNK
jgi:hypothetical protein